METIKFKLTSEKYERLKELAPAQVGGNSKAHIAKFVKLIIKKETDPNFDTMMKGGK